jgi:hypothetical protein
MRRLILLLETTGIVTGIRKIKAELDSWVNPLTTHGPVCAMGMDSTNT